jgi:hypothetical protein
LKVSVYQAEQASLESVRSFLEASEKIRFESQSRAPRLKGGSNWPALRLYTAEGGETAGRKHC